MFLLAVQFKLNMIILSIFLYFILAGQPVVALHYG